MKKREIWFFKVTGHRDFPTDMLRYDQCWPAHTEDALSITSGYVINENREVQQQKKDGHPYTVYLQSRKEPTISRWSSFGWVVEVING